MHLAGMIREADNRFDWPGVPDGITISAWAGSLQCEHGMLSKQDLLQWVDIGGTAAVGFALGFAKTESDSLPFLVFVWEYHSCNNVAWVKTGAVHLLNACAVVGSVPYFVHGDTVVPLLHRVRG